MFNVYNNLDYYSLIYEFAYLIKVIDNASKNA